MKRGNNAPLYVIRRYHGKRSQVEKALRSTVDSFWCYQAALAGKIWGRRANGFQRKIGDNSWFRPLWPCFSMCWMLPFDERGRSFPYFACLKKKKGGAYDTGFHCKVWVRHSDLWDKVLIAIIFFLACSSIVRLFVFLCASIRVIPIHWGRGRSTKFTVTIVESLAIRVGTSRFVPGFMCRQQKDNKKSVPWYRYHDNNSTDNKTKKQSP